MEYKNETKQCQNCRKDFTIEPDDFAFYETMKVPPPTFCFGCRTQRRYLFRNERELYKRKCDATGQQILSMYSESSDYKVYDKEYWWSDKWDAIEYGQDYNFDKPFFEQCENLFSSVPALALSNRNPVNSDYCNFASGNKDCYLLTAGGFNERVLYSNRPMYSKESLDGYIIEKCELCYECLYCQGCYHLFFSKDCESCVDGAFLYNCRGCVNCFGCTNLRNKQYCLFNKQYTKEEYQEKIKQFDLGGFKALCAFKTKIADEVLKNNIHKFAETINCTNSSGDHIRNAKNCHWCFDMGGDKNENCKFIAWGGFVEKDSYDTGPGAGYGGELIYETIDTVSVSRLLSCVTADYCSDLSYCINCYNSEHLFGCINLRSKKYCILNKQYTKEEYEALVPKIIQHMNDMPYIDKKGGVYKYGEFFPAELSPFAYNETIAQEYFPLGKEQAIEQGYDWKEPEEKNYKIDLKSEDLPDHIKDINDDIVGKVIECSHKGKCNHQCTTAFKIIKEELQFYRKMNLPLARLCPNCRHYERLKQRNPLKLWHRKCMKPGCENEFETSYASDRPEIVYCEKCYNEEVA